MDIIRLSISEASRLFGVSTQTIRRALKAAELPYVVVRGRYRLNFESVLKWSQKKTTTRNKLEREGIGKFVGQWKIKNPLYSPNPKSLELPQESKKLDSDSGSASGNTAHPPATLCVALRAGTSAESTPHRALPDAWASAEWHPQSRRIA